MTLLLDYLRPRRLDDHDTMGRASCNRAIVSVLIFSAWLFLVPHQLPALTKVDFLAKRVLPVALVVLASWGIYYGIRGLTRDKHRVAAIVGLLLNTTCLLFHGLMVVLLVLELVHAFQESGGRIQTQYR